MPNELTKGLLHYWPEQSQVLEVLKTQAESFSTPVLLAVHQPMEFSVEDDEGRKIGDADQETLLARLLEDHPDGYRIIPLVGPPGVGKSHAIRWVHAKINELEESDKYQVVRVQKGASLRSVLDQVAEGLDGPAYRKFTKRIQEAQEGLTEKQLFWALTGELSEELENPGEWVKNSPDLEEKHECWQEGLRAFLGDHVVRTEYLKKDDTGPLALLARRIHEGVHPDEVGDEGRRQEFLPQDFLDAQDAVQPVLDRLSVDAQEFFRGLSDTAREECTRLLNEALDPATARLLNFRGGELEGLFVEVRQQLQREGKEWVLLLEDLTALSGIRTALFNIMVRGKDAQDKEELCTIRSVLAATPGHVSNIGGPWDTLKSRAEQVFTMSSGYPKEKDHVTKAVELVGAYLNAVRFGRGALEESFLRRARDGCWPGVFQRHGEDPRIAEVLNSFGESSRGYHLFPMNPGSIRQRLLSEYRTRDGRLEFTPRQVIGSIIRDTLNRREEFEAGEFPSNLFGKQSLKAEELVISVSTRVGVGKSPNRHLRVLSYWGDQPRSEGEAARLPTSIYEAFGLTPLDFGEPAPVPDETPEEDTGSQEDTEVSGQVDQWKEKRSQWQDALTKWRTGEEILGQREARKIREVVAEAVYRGLPAGWPGLPRLNDDKDRKRLREATFLPRTGTGLGAKRGDLGKAAIVVCEEDDLKDEKKAAEIVRDLLMVLLFHDVGGGSWEALERFEDFDFRRYSAFVNRHRDGVARWIREQFALSPDSRACEAVVEGLLMSAAALGSPRGEAASLEARASNLFWTADQRRADATNKWDMFLNAARDFQTHSQKEFQSSFCSFQGSTGSIPHAADLSDIFEKLKGVDIGTLGRAIPGSEQRAELGQRFNVLRRTFKPGFDERVEELAKWGKSARTFLNEDFLRQYKELLELATAENLDVELGGNDLARRVREGLNGLPEGLAVTVEKATSLRSQKNKFEKLVLLAGIDPITVESVERLLFHSERYLNLVEPRARQRAKMLEGDDVEASLAALLGTVEGVQRLLEVGHPRDHTNGD